MIPIPTSTIDAPMNCNSESRSFKKKYAKIMVEIGPILPIIEKLEEPNLFIAKDTKKEGINVDITAIKKPKIYTSFE